MSKGTKDWLLRILLERRTHSIEVFLAVQALVTGIWILWPGKSAFSSELLSLIPDALLGATMVLHGTGSLMALWYGNVGMCRRAARASTAMWAFLFTVFVFAPPRTLLTMPLVLGLALASFWVFLRLYLRYPPTGGIGS